MLQVKVILDVLSATVLTCVGTCMPPTGQMNETRHSAKAETQLELTQADVFATRNWSSEAISVLGFRLGMKRAEAIENARKNRLDLIASTLADTAPCATTACDVCEKNACVGVGLNFGNDDRIEAIHVMRPLRESAQDIRAASITRHFKGQTYSLFHSYSDELRLRLFGHEADRIEDRKVRATKYLYPQFGMEVSVNLSANKRIPESKADLTISFFHSAKPSGQIQKPAS